MHATNPQLTAKTTNPDQLLSISEIPHRIRNIAIYRGLGYSFREIAAELNVTPQAVSLMLSRHRRALKSLNGAMELSHLSARAVNALGRYGINTREEARKQNILALLQNERNCGRKTLDEIERWLADGSKPEQPQATEPVLTEPVLTVVDCNA